MSSLKKSSPVILDSDEEEGELDIKQLLENSSDQVEPHQTDAPNSSDVSQLGRFTGPSLRFASPGVTLNRIDQLTMPLEHELAKHGDVGDVDIPQDPSDAVLSQPSVKRVATVTNRSLMQGLPRSPRQVNDEPPRAWYGAEQSSTIANSTSDMLPPTATEEMSSISVLSNSTDIKSSLSTTPRQMLNDNSTSLQNVNATHVHQHPGSPVIILPAQGELTRTKKRKRKNAVEPDADEDRDELSNEASNEAPAEQYKPRPSLSRSAASSNRKEHSTSPSAEGKEGSKRRGADRSSRRARDDSRSSEHRNFLQEMGFPSSQIDRALEQHPRSVNDALDYLKQQDVAPTPSQRQGRGEELASGPHADSASTPTDANVTDTAMASSAPTSSNKHRKKRKHLNAAPSTSAAAELDSPTTVKPTKRKRGRPRKSCVSSEVDDKTATEDNIELKHKEASNDGKDPLRVASPTNALNLLEEGATRTPLNEISLNVRTEATATAINEQSSEEAPQQHTGGINEHLCAKKTEADEKGTEADTTRQPSETAADMAKTASKSLALGKKRSKLADICARTGQTHRVGLSKRLQIESLLRKTQPPKNNIPKAEPRKGSASKKAM